MNRLVIIGNGFDMAHGFKTSYKDFINWYCNQRVDAFAGNSTKVSEDCLCKFTINEKSRCSNLHFLSFNYGYFKDSYGGRLYPGYEAIKKIWENPEDVTSDSSHLFTTIMQSLEKGWVDIENDYYRLLKESIINPKCGYTVKELNEQLAFLKEKLVEYLSTISINWERKDLKNAMIDLFNPADCSTEGRQKAQENVGLDFANFDFESIGYEERNKLIPKRIMLLSFNYTETARRYGNFNMIHNYIHGELRKPKSIIFGYGDELDKNYQDILDTNDNELLRNVKSVKYLETRHYRDMLEFIQEAPFQVLIMGHSCGNSDRTLLNTVFEHENCVSIKPFYHKWDDGSDNYLELVQNISRNFTNMRLFRDRVVNKEQCKTM